MLFISIDLTQEDDLDEMRHRVQLINQNKPPTSYIQQYAVYEHLGTGAFGSVYKVRPLIYLFFALLYKNQMRKWDLGY